ncbi:MAG: cytochrome c oxidase subunit II transmembrane domain-containing protein [Phycisphaerales bacterium]
MILAHTNPLDHANQVGHSLLLGQSMMDKWTRLNFGSTSNSSIGQHSDWLFFWIYAISAFFFVLLMVLMVYFTVVYRRRPGVAPKRSAAHNTMLELSWSVIPTILLVWMFFEGFWGFAGATVAPSHGPELMLTGKKWAWTMQYPNGAVSSDTTSARVIRGGATVTPPAGDPKAALDSPIFVVPAKTPIRIKMISEDVLHAFWIPDLRVKFDVVPNRYTMLWFDTLAITGDSKLPDGTPYQDHWVFCAEYCGTNHSEMYAVIRVVPPDAYERIIEAWNRPTGTPAERGEKLYKIKGCNACHSIDGSKNVGPTWKNLYGHAVRFTDGTAMSDEERTGLTFDNYIRDSVKLPAKKIVATFTNQMQSYEGKITEEELSYILAFMKSPKLTDRAPAESAPAPEAAPGATPEEPKKN